jgi:FlaA1/EpsC-like NDP-sugar epimerase|tara:strand:+ start:406 stop:822 length:417 start_codon:yes stop_codon:yes gene_type:complete
VFLLLKTLLTDIAISPLFAYPGNHRATEAAMTFFLERNVVRAIVISIAVCAIIYLGMDIAVKREVFRHLRQELEAKAPILLAAIILDVVVLTTFLVVKARSDILVVIVALLAMLLVFAGERLFLRQYSNKSAALHSSQ